MTFECWVCDKEFDTESALSQHLSGAGHYQCYKCERIFGDSTALGQHIDSCHEYGDLMDCNCGGRFAYDHNANCMVCESCGRDPEGETV